MSGILDGLSVVEMGHFVAVPSAASVLADWGADVVKIEPIAGDAQRGAMALLNTPVNWRFEVHNRNKKSLALDLKKARGRDILRSLVKRADVFMSNYELAALDRLELDYDTLSRLNPRLVYAYLTGYGTAGPDRHRRGFDTTAAWARSGIQYLMAENGHPPRQRGGVNDRTTGFHMIAGIMAALFHREKTGHGHQIGLSLYQSGVWTLAADLQVALGGMPLSVLDRTATQNPLVNTYHCKDDRWLQVSMLQADLFWAGFCRALEKPELIDDPRFSTIQVRRDNAEELIRILDQVFLTRDVAEWEQALMENDCIYGRIQSPEEVINDPQALANDFFPEIEHPVAGRQRFVASPLKFHQNPASVRTSAPEAGQHTEEVLLDLGYGWEDIAQFKEEGVIP